jgi:hypothetical protein
LRTLEFAQGLSPGLRNQACDEVLYVLTGQGTLLLDGHSYAIEPEMGFYIKPQQTFAIANPQAQPLVLISSQCPEPEQTTELVEAITTPINQPPERPPLVRLADCKAIPTADAGIASWLMLKSAAASHAIRWLDPARPRARSLSPIRRSAFHLARRRSYVGGQNQHTDCGRLLHLFCRSDRPTV